MKTRTLASMRSIVVALSIAAGGPALRGQGTILFGGQVGPYSTNYSELGMDFRVVVPTPGAGSPNHDGMVIAGPITFPSNIPYDSTSYMLFFRQNSPDDFVAFWLSTGSTFGLTSVQLADPSSPSLSPVSISFLGFRMDGSTVTNTFTTPGNGATTFQSYQFSSAFASGLSSVAIDAPRWAMDNLTFGVPEPSVGAIFLLGLSALRCRTRRGRHL
jgi:hypothetical protein